ncbi:hypothetical protein [Pseudomonas sp. URMO17WK12:I2]|uniref:hypothetical protein n=1 Tax=Pseudomonas sp. URMO17WK12:I2 TaxID=1261623 RepID=UPI000DB6DBFE|nr:hypothetical protein [Pseudomonas sp. URMO17WK12:I2]PZW44391.1 hypothetical protein F469_02913 [Pseudomonas sp. URMO17WK12:I2]
MVNQHRQITLKFDGTLAPQNGVSLRTISYTVPHIQRAIDKSVYFLHFEELRKFSTLPMHLHSDADLYIYALEKGSLKFPFFSDLAKEVPDLFNAFMSKPYEEAAHEVIIPGTIMQTDLETNKIHAAMGNLDYVTQEQMLAKEAMHKKAYAQSAVMKDMSLALGVVRVTPGAILALEVDSEKGAKSYEFDQNNASRFARLTTTKRLEDAVVYNGRITGLERQRGNARFEFAAKFLSRATGTESKILISNYDDAMKLHPYNLTDKDVLIWAAPISTYGSFDPVRGDLVFVDMFKE